MENQTPLIAVYITEDLFKRQIMPNGFASFNMTIAATAENYEQIQPELKTINPEFIVLEYEFMPDDIHSLIKKIKSENPNTKLLLIGVYNRREIAKTFIKAGADGYYDQHCPAILDKIFSDIQNGITVIMPSIHKRRIEAQQKLRSRK